MSDSTSSPVVVVTGANGFVGARVCAHLLEAGATVRAVVRREGAAPAGTDERVGDFAAPAFAADVVRGATALVTTVHPLGGDDETQRRVAVEGTPMIVAAARDAGVPLAVHLSTASVYDRRPGAGDVDEQSALVGDGANTYAVTKRDTDAAIAELDDLTRVLVRPPAILGPGETSVWNTVRPAQLRDDPDERHAVPDGTFAWVHVDDLARLVADLATGVVATAEDADDGPVEGGCTAVNVAASPAVQRDYLAAACEALGVEPTWDDGPAWTGRIVAERARRWGWTPRTELDDALAELRSELH